MNLGGQRRETVAMLHEWLPAGARGMAAAALVLLTFGCSSPAAPTKTTTPPVPAPETVGATSETESDATVLAHIEVVDRSGAPLAGMAPIVSRKPNALDDPLADGALTGPDGLGSVRAPVAEHLYLRAWDPKMAYFANNFYDLLPGGAGETETLRVTMVESGGFTADLRVTDGKPLANTEVRALLVHPAAGPWWPVKAVTGPDGKAVFKPVPAGQFAIRLGTADSAPVDLPSLLVPPGEIADAGVVMLAQ